jgi:guanine deaminase
MASVEELLRAPVLHTTRNPFFESNALESYADGGLLIRDGRIAGCDDYTLLQRAYPYVPTTDLRGGFLLPGFVDTHTHFPQLRILGALGEELLSWLQEFALPEEMRMADLSYACGMAQLFLHLLASHGTTTALVFGAHFAPATASLFEAADRAGLRIISGLVLSDRSLRPELHQTVEQAYRESSELIRRFHGRGRLLYAVTPRFALSTSEAMLEVCQSLMREHPELRMQTHLNESRAEIDEVARMFPWAKDYLAVYERFHLTGRRAVMAHNVHPSTSQLERLAASATTISHCPCSNAALGSGLFPLKRHIQAGVHVSLGTDVGGGIGVGMLKEGLQAYLLQRLSTEGLVLTSAQLLYLATRAGAQALNLESEIGDFTSGKSADLVYLRPPKNSPLAAALERADSLEHALAALFTLGDSTTVSQVRVGGTPVYRASDVDDD